MKASERLRPDSTVNETAKWMSFRVGYRGSAPDKPQQDQEKAGRIHCQNVTQAEFFFRLTYTTQIG